MQAFALRKRCDVSEDCIVGLGCSAGLCISTYALPHTSRVRGGGNASTPASTFWGTQPQNGVQILSQKGCEETWGEEKTHVAQVPSYP